MIVSFESTPGIHTRGCGFCSGTSHGLITRRWYGFPSWREGAGWGHALMATPCASPRRPRVRLLQRRRPRIDHAVVVVVALVAEGPGLGPRLDDDVVRFLEALAVVRRVHAGGELLLAAAAHEAGDEAALRHHVDHRQ